MNKRSTKYGNCSLVNHTDQTRIAHVEPQTCRERCHLLNYHRDCSGDAISSISLSVCLSSTCLLLTSTCPLIRNVTHCIAQYAGGNSDDLHAAGEIEAQVTSWRRWRLQKKVSSAVAARTHTHTHIKTLGGQPPRLISRPASSLPLPASRRRRRTNKFCRADGKGTIFGAMRPVSDRITPRTDRPLVNGMRR